MRRPPRPRSATSRLLAALVATVMVTGLSAATASRQQAPGTPAAAPTAQPTTTTTAAGSSPPATQPNSPTPTPSPAPPSTRQMTPGKLPPAAMSLADGIWQPPTTTTPPAAAQPEPANQPDDIVQDGETTDSSEVPEELPQPDEPTKQPPDGDDTEGDSTPAPTQDPTPTPTQPKPEPESEPESEPKPAPAAAPEGLQVDCTGHGCGHQHLLDGLPTSRFGGWTMTLHGDRAGYVGITHTSLQHIDIYVRHSWSDSRMRHAVAHELGHAADLTWLHNDQRRQWYQQRNIDPTVDWWSCNGCSDFATAAGDFAETYATCTTDNQTWFNSEVAGPPDGQDCRAVQTMVDATS